MKRSRDDSDFSVYWHVRDGGTVVGSWPRCFLKKYSQFFECLFRSEESRGVESEHVSIRQSYHRDNIKALFRHLDGESLNLTKRGERNVESAIDFLKLNPPFDRIDNNGFEPAMCCWCGGAADGSICRAKRWHLIEIDGQNKQQCPVCCLETSKCVCDWLSFENPHCDDAQWVRAFKYGLEITS